ncbi:MAG: glycosyltransferase, partial [Bacteroidota bacterium]
RQYGVENFILCVADALFQQNHELLIRAYRKLSLHKGGVALVLIGKNKIADRRILRQFEALKREWPQKIYWFPSVESTELPAFYRAARLLVQPGKNEGFGFHVLEAVVSECNTLCANLAGMVTFDFMGEQRFFPYDQQRFDQKLMKNMLAPPSGAKLRELADEARRRYSWQQAANSLHVLLQKEVAPSKKTARWQISADQLRQVLPQQRSNSTQPDKGKRANS